MAEDIPKWLKSDRSYQDFLEMLDDSERMIKFIRGSDGKPHSMWCVTEGGVYHIINALFNSDDKAWRDYFTDIRDGITFYKHECLKNQQEGNPQDEGTDPQRYTINEVLENPDILINALNRLKEEQEKNRRLTKELDHKSEIIAELEPKAAYYDKVLNTVNGVSPSVIAKEYGKSAMWLNNLLHKLKIQYKQGETWMLYSRYADKGYTCTKTHQYVDEYGVTRSVIHTYWTQAGRKLIYDVLKKHGIEPVA